MHTFTLFTPGNTLLISKVVLSIHERAGSKREDRHGTFLETVKYLILFPATCDIFPFR